MKLSRMVLRASAAALVLLLGVGVLFSPVYATSTRANVASAQTASALTITRLWTRDAQGHDQTSFTPGQSIQYLVSINNTSGVAFKAQFIIRAYFENNDYGSNIIFSLNQSNIPVPKGKASYYAPSTVPKTASAGWYTLYVAVISQYPAPSLAAEQKVTFTVS